MRDVVPPPEDPASGPLRWRVSPALPGLKIAAAGIFALLGAVFAGDPVRLALAAAATAGLAGWAARDLIAPVRIAADAAGLTVVSGYAGRRLVRWDEIERIRVDTRPRLGLRTQTLEIDTGEDIHLFSAYDLGAPPEEVAARLAEVRARSAASPSSRGQEPEGPA